MKKLICQLVAVVIGLFLFTLKTNADTVFCTQSFELSVPGGLTNSLPINMNNVTNISSPHPDMTLFDELGVNGLNGRFPSVSSSYSYQLNSSTLWASNNSTSGSRLICEYSPITSSSASAIALFNTVMFYANTGTYYTCPNTGWSNGTCSLGNSCKVTTDPNNQGC